jgi:hypothetical protein
MGVFINATSFSVYNEIEWTFVRGPYKISDSLKTL